ncbi:MAG: DUF6790 family protein [Methanobacterium sp.]|uniref:DUF6790 family protein n=1 Tax=Methanobacterium sp. TaxID=2164 RepID=UPI003C773398
MDFVYVISILTILIAIFVVLISKITSKPLNRKRVVEIFLLSFLVISVGFGSIWAFIGHFFLSAQVAASIGWAPGSPFQSEVAFANLSIGVLGLLCYWIRDNFWTATVIASSIFLLGNAYGHILNMILYSNYAPGNAGSILYMDIIGPIILIVLLILYKSLGRNTI